VTVVAFDHVLNGLGDREQERGGRSWDSAVPNPEHGKQMMKLSSVCRSHRETKTHRPGAMRGLMQAGPRPCVRAEHDKGPVPVHGFAVQGISPQETFIRRTCVFLCGDRHDRPSPPVPDPAFDQPVAIAAYFGDVQLVTRPERLIRLSEESWRLIAERENAEATPRKRATFRRAWR
jgi:hypothetical protein